MPSARLRKHLKYIILQPNDMKQEKFDLLEQTPEIQEVLHRARQIRDRENNSLTPVPFSHLSRRLPPPRKSVAGNRKKFSPSFRSSAWFTAACLVGILMGWHIPRPGGELTDLHTLYDTVRTTDTVIKYIEIPVGLSKEKKLSVTASVTTTDTAHQRSPSNEQKRNYISPENRLNSLPISTSDGQFAQSGHPVLWDQSPETRRGKSVEEENFLLHFIAH